MRIAVIHHTGVLENDYGFYVSDLLSEYAAWLGYEVLLLEDFLFRHKKTLPENAVIGIDVKAKGSFGLRWWYNAKLPGILDKIKADVVVNLNGMCSTSAKQPQVLAVSDISFFDDNAKANAAWKKLVLKNIIAYSNAASSVFSYSHHAAGIAEKITGQQKGSVHIVPYSADKDYKVWQWHEKNLIKAEFAENKEFFVCTLGDENHELWLLVLKAFSKFKKWQQSSMQLFLLPKHGIVPLKVIDKMGTYKYKDDVQMLDNLTEKEKSSLVGCAYALIHLPGNDADLLPVAEALQCAVPAITSKTVSLDEYAAGAVLNIPAIDHEVLGDAIISVFKNEDERTNIVENAKAKAEEFKRDDIAKSLWEMIENAVKTKQSV